MSNFKTVILFFMAVLFLVPAAGHAEEEKPAWLQPEVLKSAVAINMTDEQQPKFQTAITAYLTDLQKSYKKILRGRDTTDLERKIKRMNKKLTKKMDDSMAEFLSEQQMPKYELYRDALINAMKP
jgi:hypothetical protein|tara:strand:+ start:1174 stop:1548 length:375 start_codon:yes stop_codon:yes gene_type:complete